MFTHRSTRTRTIDDQMAQVHDGKTKAESLWLVVFGLFQVACEILLALPVDKVREQS